MTHNGYEIYHQLRTAVDAECSEDSVEWQYRRDEIIYGAAEDDPAAIARVYGLDGLDGVVEYLDSNRVQCCDNCGVQCPGGLREWLEADCLCSDCEHVHETDHDAHAVAHGPGRMG